MVNEKYSNVGNEALVRATGKEWSEWFTILDSWGAVTQDHKAIADYLYAEQSVPAWWCQAVTVGYEQARGLRAKNQKSDGYVVSVSKVLPFFLNDVYSAWSENHRKKWLPEVLIVTSEQKNKSLRAKLLDDSRLSVNFYDKKDGKMQLVIEHGKLKSEKAVEKQREFWKKSFERLVSHLT